jgi:hypothetical protein
MVWDPYYGKQGNPYSVEDFEIILEALKSAGADAGIIARTQEALETEREEE